MYTSMTPRQFRRRFRTEGDCLRYVIRRKWPEGFRCPRCGHNRPYLIETRKLYQCAHCGHQTSVTAHTIFHKTRKPLRDWFWAIFLVATRTTGSSARQLQHDLGLSYQTAWTWCHKIRKAMKDRDTRYTLRGMIELDDTYIGGKKKPGKRGRGARSKVPVMVAVESRPKGCAHVALSTLAPFSSQQTESFLHQKVHHDSIITSDGLYLYRPLAQGFNVCQIPLRDGQRAIDIFPHVHRVIARLKTWIRGTHSHVSSKHLDQYLAEFSYRFNRRFKHRRTTIFDRLVTACCATQAITYRQLVADLSG
jgi:transposase-like protein